MVDVAVSAQLQQWSFDKPSVIRPDRSDSAATSPQLYDNDTLRIETSAANGSQDLDTTPEKMFQERYLSSEEDLSPMEEPNSDEESEKEEEEVVEEVCSARKMSISRFEKGKSCDMAVVVSYVSAGRPKMINLASPTSPTPERTTRSASLALPVATHRLRLADQASRFSLAAPPRGRSNSPAKPRRPSIEHLPTTQENSAQEVAPEAVPEAPSEDSSLRASDSSSSLVKSSAQSTTSSRSEGPIRPMSAVTAPRPVSRTSSLYLSSRESSLVPFPPLTPLSSEPPAFLSSDPYENSTTSAASPIIKPAPHRRLRSISQKLSLARIAIGPAAKKWDSRINGKSGNVPGTPASVNTPTTPMSAPLPTFASPKSSRLRRNSKLAPRGAAEREPPIEIPPMPQTARERPLSRTMPKLVPRGASERAPPLELPPFPENEPSDAMSVKSKKTLRKRKSLMDLDQIRRLI